MDAPDNREGGVMATNKERQAAYRRRLKETTNKRINVVLSDSAYTTLTKISESKGKTQKEIIESLVMNAGRLMFDVHAESHSLAADFLSRIHDRVVQAAQEAFEVYK
jgi:hypothetical protein